MCKGFGILVNFNEVRYKANNSAHHKIVEGALMDKYCKLEVVFDATRKAGYRIQLDDNIDDVVRSLYREQGFLTKNNKVSAKIMSKAKAWVKDNELIVFKSFAHGTMVGSTFKGNQYQHESIFKGNQNQNESIFEGNQYQNGSTFEGNQYQSRSTFEGDQYQSRSTFKGDQYQNRSTFKKKMFIHDIKFSKHPRITGLIRQASEEISAKGELLDFVTFIKWIQNKKVIDDD